MKNIINGHEYVDLGPILRQLDTSGILSGWRIYV